MKLEQLQQLFNLSDIQLKQLDDYANFLVEYNKKINLTAITKYEEIIEKHFYDSLIPLLHEEIYGTLVDVGTGAGFPGVVLKIVKPELKVLLVEPIKKRCLFLNELISLLRLKDIEVINNRGEEYSLKHREEYDFVTARAVCNLNSLIEICGAMVKINGKFIALRGKDGLEELKEASFAIKTMGYENSSVYKDKLSDGSVRICSFIEKTSRTSKSFPRKYSIIKHEPLCKK